MSRLLALLILTLPVQALAQDEADDGSNIPTDQTIGVGIGFVAPSGTLAFNTASARFRLAEGFALEPTVSFGLNNSRSVVEVPDDETTNADRSSGVTLGADARIRLTQRDDVELMGIAGAGLNIRSTTNDPEGTENNTTTNSTSLSLAWGVGVNWWVHPHFCLSGDVRNPLVNLSSSKTTNEGNDASQSTSALGLQISFLPQARVMGHVTF